MQQIADKMNFQNPVQKYAECHSWDMSNSNATKYHEIKVGILDTCFKENVPTFEILVGWILRLGLNFWVINVALYGWKCDPAYLVLWENHKNWFLIDFFNTQKLDHDGNKMWAPMPWDNTFQLVTAKFQETEAHFC